MFTIYVTIMHNINRNLIGYTKKQQLPLNTINIRQQRAPAFICWQTCFLNCLASKQAKRSNNQENNISDELTQLAEDTPSSPTLHIKIK
jgi:hypothetical protein